MILILANRERLWIGQFKS